MHYRRLWAAAGSAVLLKGLCSKLPWFRPPTFLSTNVLLSWHLWSTCQGHEIHKETLRLRFEMLMITGRAFRPFYTTEKFLRQFQFKRDIFLKQLVIYAVTALGITPLSWILPRACNIHIAKLLLPAACVHGSKVQDKGQPFDHHFLNWWFIVRISH